MRGKQSEGGKLVLYMWIMAMYLYYVDFISSCVYCEGSGGGKGGQVLEAEQYLEKQEIHTWWGHWFGDMCASSWCDLIFMSADLSVS